MSQGFLGENNEDYVMQETLPEYPLLQRLDSEITGLDLVNAVASQWRTETNETFTDPDDLISPEFAEPSLTLKLTGSINDRNTLDVKWVDFEEEKMTRTLEGRYILFDMFLIKVEVKMYVSSKPSQTHIMTTRRTRDAIADILNKRLFEPEA